MATTKKTVKKAPVKETRTVKTTAAAVKVSKPKKTTRSKKETEMVASEMDNSSEAPKSRVITRKYLYAVAAVVVLVALLFVGSKFWVVAWVDNKPITKFELYGLMEKRDQGKTAEELIVQKLLVSEGNKQNQKVSDAEIEAEIKKIEDLQGGASQLDQILAVNNTSREDFRKLVELQLLKQKLFGGDVNVTEEQVTQYIDQNKDALPPETLANPESSEAAKLKENVKDQLKQTKIQENFNTWLEGALNSSRVIRMVPAPTQAPLPQMGEAPQQ